MAEHSAKAQEQQSGAGAQAPLGIYAKYPAAFSDRRRENYDLQWSARKLRRGFRVSKCHSWAVPNEHIKVLHSEDHGKAFYGGLQVCGSVWECPVCASKISERRRAELQAAMAFHRASGGYVLLLTLTNPHQYGDDLSLQLKRQAKALDSFRRNRAGRKFFDGLGVVGSIRSLEVTHGANGWHPHFHILLFCRLPAGVGSPAVPAQAGAAGGPTITVGKSFLEFAKRQAYAIWLDCCLKAGLAAPSFRHGVDLQDGSYAERYVSKWGLESEMTKGHIKKGKEGGRTPFDLLRNYRDGDKKSGALFVEYCNAFKGKRQLVWSNGLKAMFAIADLNDEELIAEEQARAQVGYQLSRSDWKNVQAQRVRAHVLEAFENGGAFELAQFLALLRGEDQPPAESPDDSEALALLQLMDEKGWSFDQMEAFLAWRVSECS